MSGVFGLIKNRERPSDGGELLQTMGRHMAHRPWYQVDSFFDEQAGVGLGRIGIGIFNPEKQPAASEDGSIRLVMSGEFYYQAGLRRELEKKGASFRNTSDAELALRLYQDRGPDFVKAVEGAFVLALWDRSQNQVLVANDRFGLKPLYYTQSDGGFLFAPELKGILADPGFARKLNLTALAEYVRFQQLLGDKTFFEGITLLPPASLLCLDCQTLKFTQSNYWDWRSIRSLEKAPAEREAVEETERLFRQAVNVRLERTARPGILLSGGLDSRTILALANRQYQPLTTITYGHPDCRDVYLAARIARAAGARHTICELRDGNWVKEVAGFHLELTEGAHSWIHAHGLSTLPRVRELMEVNISGCGPGMMSGFFEKPTMIHAPDEDALVSAMFYFYTQQHSWPGLTEAEAQTLYTCEYHDLLRDLALNSLRAELARFDHPDIRLRSLFFHAFNHDRRMILNSIVFNNSHVENRLPFYDYRLIDWAASLPAELKNGKRLHRAILSHIAPALAVIPYDKDYRLPTTNHLVRTAHAAFDRSVGVLQKQFGLGRPRPTLYADYENYLRGELREWAEAILFDKRTLARGIFRPQALRSLMDRHLAGHEEWTIGKIAPIMTIEMMLRRLYDPALPGN
jgi:asparagine synthase (glutamine-hydrolysing)